MGHLHPCNTGSTQLFDKSVELIQDLPRIRYRREESTNRLPFLNDPAKQGVVAVGKNRADILQFNSEARIRLVASVAIHRFFETHTGERQRDLDIFTPENFSHQTFHQREEAFLLGKRHLDVQLGEFGLTVRTEIFVAKTAHHLKVLLESGHHQELLEQLRRLRQRIELSVGQPARHQIIAGSFGRRFGQVRGLYFPETRTTHVVPNSHHHAVSQMKVLLHLVAPEVQVTVFQSQIFRSRYVVFDRKRHRLSLIENDHLINRDFNFTCFQVWIDHFIVSTANPPTHADHEFRPEVLGHTVRFGIALGVENNLRDSRAVPQIDKNELPMVPAAIYPSGQ